ncbi:LptF/LptG family permease [Ponticaulis sp.]|uniref:LptF/LptG family permease n=1 Tax=Ponticaulis sp. TaxID=2020902 RepID=UPI000B66B8E0|nr:LptF/LptG family permease [Ponticaulis sp.]MAI89624.1 permease [Ponticaulis sp.]OUY00649.1 MAG: permease [Hyphomonadaceae bacterium TMED5]|tara:strand:- start:168552 stop:169688 length:1137 start_codon:yes stop_codon:yes gene_type:complete
MNRIQKYIFFSVLKAVVTIVGGLAVLALLAQGLSQTDLIVDNRQSALTYLRVVALGAPQIIAVLGPIALFVGALNALNRIHRDSEIVVAQSAGMTRWQIASPVIRLAVAVAIAHLCVNLFVQPMAQRELRQTISDARADLASSLIRPGAFTYPVEGLTIYVRESSGGVFRNMMIADTRFEENEVIYIAQTGNVIEIEGQPAIRMTSGQIQQVDQQNQLSVLNFDDYVFELTDFLAEDSDLVLKASDRFLHELFFPDLGDYVQNQNQDLYLAEAHLRIASPLLNLAMGMIAVLAVIGGNFSRRGYQKRIAIATGGALVLVILSLSIPPSAESDPALNILQYLIPLGTTGILSYVFLRGGISLPFAKRKTKPSSDIAGAA